MGWVLFAIVVVFVIRAMVRDAAALEERTQTRHSGSTSPWRRQHASDEPSGDPVPSRWIPAGEPIEVAGLTIPGGMLYVGSTLKAPNGDPEPAQIDPRCNVDAATVDMSQRLMDYWPHYNRISSSARRAYLQWLSTGRDNPNADVGYVFLFFYGLERRVLVDAPGNPEIQTEIPAIVSELKRLQGLYAGSNSFRRYSSQLLDLLDLQGTTSRAYEGPVPVLSRRHELPMRLRLALGQLAVDGKPLPARWALAWAKTDPNLPLPRAATRVAEEFDALFQQRYARQFGEGMKLAVNRTKLRLGYQAASPGLLGVRVSIEAPDVPDVSVVTTPVKKLHKLVEECAEALGTYSRIMGKSPEKRGSLEALALLPPDLWPARAREALRSLQDRASKGLVAMPLDQLVSHLGGTMPLTRARVGDLVRMLEAANLGIEPDVLAGARTPKDKDTVVLFTTLPEEGSSRGTPPYQAAAVTLDLATAVAAADGELSGPEIRHLSQHVDSWGHLSPAHRRRLKAHLRRVMDAPPTPASLRKRLEPLAVEAKQAVGRFLAHLAQVDGTVTPGEVKLLEKVYKTLGIDAQALYSDLHIAAAGGAPAAPAAKAASVPVPSKGAAITLDPARIQALQKETEQVAALLAGVFVEEAPPATDVPLASEPEPEETGTTLLGLDAEHSAFLRALVGRKSWPRTELADIAADMELMLDGAIEKVNEATADAAGGLLLEGDDPIELNHDIMEKLPV